MWSRSQPLPPLPFLQKLVPWSDQNRARQGWSQAYKSPSAFGGGREKRKKKKETDERKNHREQNDFWLERRKTPCWDAIPLLLCQLFPCHKNCEPQVLSSWPSDLLFLSLNTFISHKSRFSNVLIHKCFNKPGIRRKGRQGGHLLGLTRLRVCSPLTHLFPVLCSSLSDKLCVLFWGDKEIREINLSKEKLSTPSSAGTNL